MILPGPVRLVWGLWAWLLLIPMLLAAALPIFLVPGLARRRTAARAVCRAYFALCGLRPRMRGLARLPAGPCIIVANHASYLDGPLLFACLPPRFGFVIKKEASRLPVAGLLLRRLGHHFVERRNRNEGAGDARRILRAVLQGQAVAFFPEGTFTPRAGIGRFHNGAFAAAARAGVPVAPVAIRGTRLVLPARTVWPRRGPVEVEALEALPPAAGAGDLAAQLRDTARARIATAVNEPSL